MQHKVCAIQLGTCKCKKYKKRALHMVSAAIVLFVMILLKYVFKFQWSSTAWAVETNSFLLFFPDSTPLALVESGLKNPNPTPPLRRCEGWRARWFQPWQT